MAKEEHVRVQVDYMHICDYAFVGENGKAGIIGIFDTLGGAAFPVMHPVMTVSVKLRGQPGHVVNARLAIDSPEGENILKEMPEGRFVLGKDGSANVNINLMTLQFKTPGRYSVSLISQGEVLVSQTLKLVRVDAKVATA